MKRLAAALAFLAAFLLVFTVQARLRVPRLEPPYVAADTAGFDRCERGPACPGRLLLVKNPQRTHVTVVVWCLFDPRTMTSVRISPRGSVTLDIGTDKPGGLKAGDCTVARWRAN